MRGQRGGDVGDTETAAPSRIFVIQHLRGLRDRVIAICATVSGIERQIRLSKHQSLLVNAHSRDQGAEPVGLATGIAALGVLRDEQRCACACAARIDPR